MVNGKTPAFEVKAPDEMLIIQPWLFLESTQMSVT